MYHGVGEELSRVENVPQTTVLWSLGLGGVAVWMGKALQTWCSTGSNPVFAHTDHMTWGRGSLSFSAKQGP